MPSAKIITNRLLNRSAITPPNGLNKATGNIAIIPAIARLLADPVFWVIHHTSTNWVNELPTKDNAWPAQMEKKRGFQFCSSVVCD